MPTRIRSRDTFYAGETVAFFTEVLDDDDLPVLTQPDQGVQVEVKNLTEDTTHDTVVMDLQEDYSGTVSSSESEAESERRDVQSITDADAEWQPGQFRDHVLVFTSGTLNGQTFRIGDNTEDTLILKAGESWSGPPAAADGYQVHHSEYEGKWLSDVSLGGNYVVGVITAQDDAVPYKSIDKVKVLLKGTLE